RKRSGKQIINILSAKPCFQRCTGLAEASIKEAEIGELRVGQPVAITVDAFPDQSFSGHVAVIGRAATSQFALLPDPNPSGNFTKITQRIPVRIRFDDGPIDLIGPGMMVEVDIDVSD
uniref:HlyD family secretion protein n=1 Tax=Salinicola peritrichatus TaxID=1267424 RepID=UPI0013A67FE9